MVQQYSNLLGSFLLPSELAYPRNKIVISYKLKSQTVPHKTKTKQKKTSCVTHLHPL